VDGLVLTHGCAKPKVAVLMELLQIPFGVFIPKKVCTDGKPKFSQLQTIRFTYFAALLLVGAK